MNYKIQSDIKLIREFFNLSQVELASLLNMDKFLISRSEFGYSYPKEEVMEKIYSYPFINGLKLNSQKEMLYKDDIEEKHILLTHAAKNEIDGKISPFKGKANNDFGKGFYCGDSYDKSISFVCRYSSPSIYFIDFNPHGLKSIEFKVDTKWMLTIAYFRGRLDNYKENEYIKKIIKSFEGIDYIVAPIADNRMFQIIDTFIDGEITDEQCKHCLAAINLGLQYVFLTEKALLNINILERCYVSAPEREYYQKEQVKFQNMGNNKSKLARLQYKGKGKYT